jgi:hypothetical protein
MISIDENTLTGIVRAEVSFARDRGLPVKRYLTVALAVADLLELPDDTRFIPATAAAMETPTRLDDPASLARTRDIALAAGYRQPPTLSGRA